MEASTPTHLCNKKKLGSTRPTAANLGSCSAASNYPALLEHGRGKDFFFFLQIRKRLTSTMRLINTKSFQLEKFDDGEIPEYAILSHTWGTKADEANHGEWIRGDISCRQKSGYKKIVKACQIAQEYSLGYLWVDTVCIDKTSSQELTEAITSMFKWYKESKICFAYLVDVQAGFIGTASKNPARSPSESIDAYPDFEQSRWFTRGWTLQELLAPREVIFFTNNWLRLGTVSTLSEHISRATNIPHSFLGEEDITPLASAAEKLSWIARRHTTREEDIVYCMLGVFQVTMEVRYGEGATAAFIRFQEKIITTSIDHTIFCWSMSDGTIKSSTGPSILAPSPYQFRSMSGTFSKFPDDDSLSSYEISNGGLRIDLPIVFGSCRFYVMLNASRWYEGESTRLCIPVEGNIGSGVVERHGYPQTPILLPKNWAEFTLECRFPLKSGPPIAIPSPLYMSNSNSYGLLLTFDRYWASLPSQITVLDPNKINAETSPEQWKDNDFSKSSSIAQLWPSKNRESSLVDHETVIVFDMTGGQRVIWVGFQKSQETERFSSHLVAFGKIIWDDPAKFARYFARGFHYASGHDFSPTINPDLRWHLNGSNTRQNLIAIRFFKPHTPEIDSQRNTCLIL